MFHITFKTINRFSDEEEYQRSAVGRYYYSCYLIARDIYNLNNNRKVGKSISHKKLIDEFKKSENKTEKDIGEYLDKLKKFRTNADYDIDFNVDLEEAKKISEKLLDCMRNFKK